MEPGAQQIPPGEQIGPYQVVRRLGAGGMGEVYLAHHRHLNRDAAVKVLLAEISMNQTVVARFFTEARATAQLRHPNIVEIFDCDVLPDGRAYIVMEYLRGESMRSALDRLGKLVPDWGSIAAITGMIADALQAAHEHGIVHRDLKPDNTFLAVPPNQRHELTVKVLDFGIAKLLSGGETTGGGGTPTRTGSLIGTPLYMSPEQCRGIPTIDHRADIYSLGCMLFEMVVGQPPFVSDAPGDILMAHIMRSAPTLTTLLAGVPPEIDTLTSRMLAKDPTARPQSMAEIVEVIEALLGMRKSEFASVLRRPTGFPELPTVQAATQILSVAEGSSAKQTPAPPKSTSNRNATTPLGPEELANHASSTMDDALFAPARVRVKWLLPLIIGIVVIGLGGSGAYYLTRPRTTSPTTHEHESSQKTAPPAQIEDPAKNAPFVPPDEVTMEVISSPEGASIWVAGEDSSRGSTPTKLTLPRSNATVEIVLKARGYLDKRLSLDVSRDRTMNVNLDPREAEREQVPTKVGGAQAASEKSATKKRKSGGKSDGPSLSPEFKPVGD